MVVEVRPDLSYDHVKEDSQRAHINHKEGTERLIISVDIEGSDEKKLWLFPIPAHYSQIETEITKEEPRIYGEKITDHLPQRTSLKDR